MKIAMTIALAVLGFLPAGWMLFDASRRLVVGDYVRINGQLGPWTHVISAAGLDPTTRAVAFIFLACGLARFVATIGYLARASWGWHALLATSMLLWLFSI
jgi:hypothetical protein